MLKIVAGCLAAAVLCGCNRSVVGGRGDGGSDRDPEVGQWDSDGDIDGGNDRGPDGGQSDNDGPNDGDADGGLPDDAALDGAGDAISAPPFPTVVRVINTGATDFLIYFQRSFACPLGFTIRGDTPASLSSTSIELPDTTCDCTTCGLGLGGGPRCVSNDLLCEDPPITVPPGGMFDFSWDGTVLTWFDAGTPAANCPIRCSRFTSVPSGTYVFSLVQPAGTFEAAPAALPAPSGVVEIMVSAP